MRKTIRFWCILCAGVVLAASGFLIWRHGNCPTIQTYEEFQKACAEGKAPDDFGGIGGDFTTVFVTKESRHTLEYWNQVAVPEESTQRFETLVQVDYSYNEVRSAYMEAAACLYGGWSRLYSYHVQAAFEQNLYDGQVILEKNLRPAGVYPPSVEEADVPGYHIYVRLWGRDADVIWKKLKEKFGDIVQPWNEAAHYRWSIMGPGRGPAVGWADAYDPLVPIDLKSEEYLMNEERDERGEGEAP